MTAAIFGASGQDGTYLAQHLAAKGERVVAIGRAIERDIPTNWRIVGLGDAIERRDVDYYDARLVATLLEEIGPRTVFVLTGLSSVRRSFALPHEAVRSQTGPTLNILEAVRLHCPDAHVVFGNSTDVFGSPKGIADESHPLDPRSPYGTGKAAAALIARSYRENYAIRCSNAFMSNHESILRSADFLFGKVLSGIARIRAGVTSGPVTTGPLSIERDWGYAPEFAEALALIGECDDGADLVLATGRSVLLRDAVHDIFRAFDLDPANHLEEMNEPFSPGVIDRQVWNPSKACSLIGWRARTGFPELADRLRNDWLAQLAV